MEYFRIMQDRHASNSILMQGLLRIKNYHEAAKGDILALDEINVLPVDSGGYDIFTDVLDRQIFMVKREILDVFLLYEPKLVYRYFYLANLKTNKFLDYFAPAIEMIDCLSDKSQYNLDKSVIEKVVIKKDNIPPEPLFPEIFRIAGVKCNVVIISLAVVESILRRTNEGIRLEPVYWDK